MPGPIVCGWLVLCTNQPRGRGSGGHASRARKVLDFGCLRSLLMASEKHFSLVELQKIILNQYHSSVPCLIR
jgi:hypothetical protein